MSDGQGSAGARGGIQILGVSSGVEGFRQYLVQDTMVNKPAVLDCALEPHERRVSELPDPPALRYLPELIFIQDHTSRSHMAGRGGRATD